MDANKVTKGWLFGFVELLYYGFVAASISIFVRLLVNFFGGFAPTVLRLIILLLCGDEDGVDLVTVLMNDVFLLVGFLGVVTKKLLTCILTRVVRLKF